MVVRWRVLVWVAAIPLVAGALGCINSLGTLSIATSQLPDDETAVPYQASSTATGGLSPFACSVVSGSLPLGVGLAAVTQQITGTPTVPGVTSFTAQVNDASGQTVSQAFNLTIASSAGTSANILAAGFETSADRACPPANDPDGTCINSGTWSDVGNADLSGCPNCLVASYLNDPAGAHSGSWYGQMQLFPAPGVTGDGGWQFAVPAAHAGDRVIYLKEWLKYPTTWRFPCCGGGNEVKAFIMENAATGGPRPILSLQAWPGFPANPAACNYNGVVSSCADICTIAGDGYHCSSAIASSLGMVADGRWHSLEMGVDTTTGHAQAWLDGVLYDDNVDSTFAGPVSWTTAKYGFHFNGPCSDTTGVCVYYIDDIGLSTTFIPDSPTGPYRPYHPNHPVQRRF